MRAWRSWSRSRRARCRATTASSTAAPARAGRPTPTCDVTSPRALRARGEDTIHDGCGMMRAMSVIPRLGLLAAGLLACPLLLAQSDPPADEAVTLDRIVVEASRLRGVNAFDMPASATVISLQDDASRAGADV